MLPVAIWANAPGTKARRKASATTRDLFIANPSIEMLIIS
jgi:hypothetical protein